MDSAWDVVVVGGGAAGLVAAERAAQRGRRTLLIEKNRRPGVKILMSGGTRCNLTHDTDSRGIVAAYGPPGRFLHSALAALGPREVVALVEAEGVATKIEETGKIFPVSDRATDILAAFMARLERTPCELALGEAVTKLNRTTTGFQLTTTARQLECRKLILTTGGQSYPGSGTTGDAYAWAVELGHTVIAPRPALTPITTNAAWVTALRGLTLPDVGLRVMRSPEVRAAASPEQRKSVERPLGAARGSLLFTHFGVSGPVALDVSRWVTGYPQPNDLALECDFLPETRADVLDEQLQREAAAAGKRQLASLFPDAISKRLAETLLEQLQLDPTTRGAELSRADRQRLATACKQTLIPVSGTRGFKHAEVTAGGVALDEVDSRTLESKLVQGLYFAGELLDLDGPIGGYNFQAAFSTGWLAGMEA